MELPLRSWSLVAGMASHGRHSLAAWPGGIASHGRYNLQRTEWATWLESSLAATISATVAFVLAVGPGPSLPCPVPSTLALLQDQPRVLCC